MEDAMPEDLPDALLQAPLYDLGVNIVVANRLEEMAIFDVASFLDACPDVIKANVGETTYDDVIRTIESFRGKPFTRPPDTWSHKPR
jgi:hypothetical protein